MLTECRGVFEMTGCLRVAVVGAGLSLVMVLIFVGSFLLGAVEAGVESATRSGDPSASKAVAMDDFTFAGIFILAFVLSLLGTVAVIVYRGIGALVRRP